MDGWNKGSREAWGVLFNFTAFTPGEVKQIIFGPIGFDNRKRGVDLIADDPLVFKKLIYEMRFGEVRADYARFGTFISGFAARQRSWGLARHLKRHSHVDKPSDLVRHAG
jgi:hypothetical protein